MKWIKNLNAKILAFRPPLHNLLGLKIETGFLFGKPEKIATVTVTLTKGTLNQFNSSENYVCHT